MSAQFEDVLEGLAERIRGVDGLAEVYAGEVDSITPPCAVVGPGNGSFITFDPAMDDQANDYTYTITLYVPGETRAAQAALWALLRPAGPTSVREAAGGYDAALRITYVVRSASSFRSVQLADSSDVRYLSCDINVEVIA